MGLGEDLELIAAVVLCVGLLPFALDWLDRTLDRPDHGHHHRSFFHRRRRHRSLPH